MRWRGTQFRLEQEGVSRIAAEIARLQSQILTVHAEVRSGSAELATTATFAFAAWASWSAYVDRSRRRIRTMEDQLRQGRKALAVQTQKMADAHKKVRVLENLKSDEHAKWVKALDRETEAFAGEAFLAQLQRGRRVLS